MTNLHFDSLFLNQFQINCQYNYTILIPYFQNKSKFLVYTFNLITCNANENIITNKLKIFNTESRLLENDKIFKKKLFDRYYFKH